MSRPRREVRPHLVPLGNALRRAREAVRPALSGNQLAKRLGWGQARVSLIETGRQTPTEADVVAWADATGADRAALLAAREAALTRHLDIREAARRPEGANALQGDLGTLEDASTTITQYEPTLIPGLAQTPAYVRAWMNQPGRVELGDPPDVDDVVSRRLERQRRTAGRAITVVVPPSVLTAVYDPTPAGRAVQRAQLDALATSVSHGSLELVVVRRPVAILHGFELLDDAVIVETVLGLHVMADPQVVAGFRELLRRMRRDGVTGRRALDEVAAARDSLAER